MVLTKKPAKKKVLDAVGIEPTTFHKYAHLIMRSDFDDVSLMFKHHDVLLVLSYKSYP